MKRNKHYFLVLLFLLLGAPLVEAQYGYGNGLGRRRSTVPQAQEPKREVKPLTAEEIVAKEMPRLIEVLDLNEFEQAVVSSILTKSVQQRIELQLLELEPDKTREAMEKIMKTQKAELKQGLPEDKYEALVAYQENGYKKQKKKKKKKKKKSKE